MTHATLHSSPYPSFEFSLVVFHQCFMWRYLLFIKFCHQDSIMTESREQDSSIHYGDCTVYFSTSVTPYPLTRAFPNRVVIAEASPTLPVQALPLCSFHPLPAHSHFLQNVIGYFDQFPWWSTSDTTLHQFWFHTFFLSYPHSLSSHSQTISEYRPLSITVSNSDAAELDPFYITVNSH